MRARPLQWRRIATPIALGLVSILAAVALWVAVTDAENPTRVAVFTSGPSLEHGLVRFLERLETETELELVGVWSQSPERSLRAVVADLLRRRGVLALPLLVLKALETLRRWLLAPLRERRLRKTLRRLAPRLHFVADVHADAVLAELRSAAPALGLVYGAPILQPALFEIPRSGTLGIHHGELPRYRGKKTTFWAMYHPISPAPVIITRMCIPFFSHGGF